jgi:histone-lysine N-methyltransferase SETMAR
MNFAREDIRKLIYYNWKRGLVSFKISDEINSTLGNNTTNERTCQRWVANFKQGNFDVGDQERCGRPSFDIDDQILALLEEHNTTVEMSMELGVCQQTIRNHLLRMGMRYMCNHWIPHKLSEQQMANRERICNELLCKYAANDFLGQLITMDEVWIYWDNDGTYHHRSWRAAGDAPDVEVRRTLSPRKHLMSVFWDCKGVILMDILPRGATITADVYCEQLARLVVAVQQKRRRLLGGGFQQIHYLHDNARPHTAAKSVQKLADIGFTVLPHPPYSPDLAPSDFYLFSPLKSALRGKIFNGVEEIQEVVDAWLDNKPRNFFADGIRKLPDRWRKCVLQNGAYFEHLTDTDD